MIPSAHSSLHILRVGGLKKSFWNSSECPQTLPEPQELLNFFCCAVSRVLMLVTGQDIICSCDGSTEPHGSGSGSLTPESCKSLNQIFKSTRCFGLWHRCWIIITNQHLKASRRRNSELFSVSEHSADSATQNKGCLQLRWWTMQFFILIHSSVKLLSDYLRPSLPLPLKLSLSLSLSLSSSAVISMCYRYVTSSISHQ